MKHLVIRVDAATAVDALWCRPRDARGLLVLAHGAGAGMEHPFMLGIAEGLAQRRFATLRYQFPYMQRGSRRPDAPSVCHATVRAAVRAAHARALKLPVFAGGKSFGGRMTSQAQAEDPLLHVRGLAFFGYPLHPPKLPSAKRGEHLSMVRVPMLFIQGTRDDLAQKQILTPLIRRLKRTATLKLLNHADHGFHVLVRSGRTDEQVREEMLTAFVEWANRIVTDNSINT